jgi:hypothetical protein
MTLSARAVIRCVQVNFFSVGGHNRFLQYGAVVGFDDGRSVCSAELKPRESGGFGAAIHFLSNVVEFGCEDVDCAFKDGDEVRMSVATIVFLTINRMVFDFCEERQSTLGIGIGLGLGLQGSTWTVAGTKGPP